MPGSRREPRPNPPAETPPSARSGRLVAVDRTLPIVKELGRHPRGIALDQLARETGLPKSTLHGMLASLCHAGFAEQDELGRYRIGLEFLRVAFEFHETRDAYDLVYPALDAIARRLGEPAFFAQLDGAEIVYSAIAEPPSAAFRALARIGGRRPAFCTALGKAILAYTLADDAGAHDFIALHGPLERRTPNSIVTRASLAAELARVREQGFATDSEEGEVGLNCVAFPIFLESRTVPAGAISVAAFASRTPLEALVDARDEIREIVERHLGSVAAPDPAIRLTGDGVVKSHEPRVQPLPRAAAGPAEAGTIVSIEALPVRVGTHARTLIHLTTSEGVTGVGEATFRDSTEVVVAAVRELARTLKDEDASRTSHLVRMMGGTGSAAGLGPERLAAIAGIDQALWDVKAKVLGVPAYELLGGRAREWIDLYASAGSGLGRAEILEWVGQAVADGFGSVMLRPLRSSVRELAGTVDAVRALVGPGVRIGLDLEHQLAPAVALAVAQAVEESDVWLLAGGSAELDGGTQLIDLASCGGMLAARRIAAAADERGVEVVLHSDLTPVTTMACAQLAMATPNIVALEWRVDDLLWREKLVLEAPVPRDGRLWVGRTPGLGVGLDLDHCHAHPYTPHPSRIARRSDGSLI